MHDKCGKTQQQYIFKNGYKDFKKAVTLKHITSDKI